MSSKRGGKRGQRGVQQQEGGIQPQNTKKQQQQARSSGQQQQPLETERPQQRRDAPRAESGQQGGETQGQRRKQHGHQEQSSHSSQQQQQQSQQGGHGRGAWKVQPGAERGQQQQTQQGDQGQGPWKGPQGGQSIPPQSPQGDHTQDDQGSGPWKGPQSVQPGPQHSQQQGNEGRGQQRGQVDPGVLQQQGDQSHGSAKGKQKGGQKQGPQRGQQKGQGQGLESPAGGSQQQMVPGDDTSKSMQALEISKGGGGGDGNLIELSGKLSKPGNKYRKKIQVYTNHYPLKIGNVREITMYDVALDPDRPKKALRVVVAAFAEKNFNKIAYAYDGAKMIFIPNELPFTELDDTIKIIWEGREKEYKMTIKKVQVVDMNQVDVFFNKAREGVLITEPPADALRAIDTVLRHSYSMGKISVGRSIFSYPKRGDSIIDLGDGMELYHGMFQSAILGQWKPFLNIDVAHKAFPKPLNVMDLIMDLNNRADLRRPLDEGTLNELKKFLRTLQVHYEIPNCPTSKRIYRVNDVDKPPGQIRFKKEDKGPEITVTQYFFERGYRIMYPEMPCLWVGSRNGSVKVPAELCTVLSGQPLNRKCNPNQTSKMIKHCATNTAVRSDKIHGKLMEADYLRDPTMKAFDFSISDKMEEISARVLNPPVLMYNGSQQSVAKGVWRAGKFLIPGQIALGWTILNLDQRTTPQSVENAKQMISRRGVTLGIDLSNYKNSVSLRLRFGREQLELKNFFAQQKQQGLDLIFVIIPDHPKIYGYVKEAAELHTGCLTQCIKSFTVFKKFNDSTVDNILLKVNAKLNGSNHMIGERLAIAARPVMIMGADVTHPAPDAQNTPSVAAVTASHDPKLFKYNICWRLQPSGNEIIADMENIVREHLMYFYRVNKNAKPEKIIMFRDGVSTGQFKQVMNAELQAIRNACSKLQQDYKPKITFLVVQKRHHTRFFPVNPRDSEDKNCNVPAGTCVDTNITSANMQDFYLVSHASIQGVAKPTKYVTLFDDNDFTNDDIEQLTYYLCHLFTRCNRSVSYPAPTYYAHLAAARAKVYCDATNVDVRNLKRAQESLTIKEDIVKGKPMFFV